MTATISRAELEESIGKGDLVVLEALPEMYWRKEHLPGALNLPLERVAELAPVLIPTLDTPVVVYCSNSACANSGIAADQLTRMGYTSVRKYAEGKEGWIAAGLPTETLPRATQAA